MRGSSFSSMAEGCCVVLSLRADATEEDVEACAQWLAAAPEGEAQIFILMLPPDRDLAGMAADALSRETELKVVEAKATTTLETGYVYLVKTGRDISVRVEGGKLLIGERGTDENEAFAANVQLKVREAQQSAVAKLGRAALAGEELEPLFDAAVTLLADTLGVEYTKVLELLDGGESLRLVAGRGWKAGLVGSGTVSAGLASQAGYTLHSKHPVVVRDLNTEERFSGPPLLFDHGVVSGMSVAIGDPGAPWGVLGIHTKAKREFSVDDVNFLQAVAHILAEAINRRNIEQQLRDRERRLNLVADAVPALIAYVDRDLYYRYCNGKYEEWFGLKPDELIDRPVRDLLGEKAYAMVEPHIRRTLAGERSSFEARLPYKHGKNLRHVAVEYVPHFDEHQEVAGYFALIRDVSERAKADEARALLASIVENSNDAIVGKTLEGTITSWNAGAQRVYGYTAEEAVGQPVEMIVPDDREDEERGIMERIRQGESTSQLETVRKRKDGTLVDVLVTVSPIRDGMGTVVGASSIAHDITDRVRAEQQLQEWADHLEDRVAERTAVAMRQARELRHLAAQITNAEQRARKQLARAIHDDLQQILVAAQMRLPLDGGPVTVGGLEKVNDLLTQALMKSRALVSELSPPVLHEGTLKDVFGWLARHMEEQHGLSITVEWSEGTEEVEDEIKTVIFETARELLFNVVKHANTDAAKVAVEVEEKSLRLRVEDCGSGFDPLRIDEGSRGFGLLSVRERIDAYAGSLGIDASPGKGATFRVEIPLERLADRAEPRRTAPSRRPRGWRKGGGKNGKARILIVDDHRIVREGLAQILSAERDMEVVAEAADGREAVEMALEFQPDIVVMDISMPRMNGIEATREIMADHPDTTVIILSLLDEEDLGAAAQGAGAAAYLRKDAASTGLIEAIREHWGV